MAVIHRYRPDADGPQWPDVPVRAYGPENSTALAATRQVLIGPDEGASNFHLRYFRVGPGGHTSLDRHAHDHGVYVLHGRARVRLGEEEELVGAGDVLYIPGDEIHQFQTEGDETFGFLCVVAARR